MLTEIKIFEILNRNRIFFSKNVRNRDHRNYEPKSKSLWNCWQKRDFRNFQPKLKFFRKCWPELRCSQFWLEIDFYFGKYSSKPRFSKFWTVFEIFPKLLTEIEIFKISNWNGNFLEKVDRNRLFFSQMPEFRNLQLKSNFFRKYWPKSRFSKFWTKMEIFSKMLIEMKIFQILNPNRAFFENVDGNLNRNRFFFANVDRNRDFWNFEPKSNFFSKIFEVEIFQNFEPKSKLFSHMLTEIEILKILNRNRNIFKNVDRNRDFQNLNRNRNISVKFWPQSRFSKFFTQIEFFSKM